MPHRAEYAAPRRRSGDATAEAAGLGRGTTWRRHMTDEAFIHDTQLNESSVQEE